MSKLPRLLTALTLLFVTPHAARPQARQPVNKKKAPAASGDDSARDREIAARFAPVFQQGLGDDERGDLITNFDFDGDWRGDNNWANAADPRFKLRAYVYFTVSETETHYFVHYAVFHPRDYKGGSLAGPLLSDAIREGVRRGGRYDPTGLSAEATLAHENDMEGCLVVAAKAGGDLSGAKVVIVETLAHDRFIKYSADGEGVAGAGRVRLEGARPVLYVEPKGHGVYAFDGGEKQGPRRGLLAYRFAGRADDPEAGDKSAAGYELLPISTTLWPRARSGVNATFGEVSDYGTLTFRAAAGGGGGRAAERRQKLGKLGAAFLGAFGAPNAARPPWGWFDRTEREQPRGAWFFDPASTIKRRHGLGAGFSTVYRHAPFLGVTRK